MSGGEKGCGVSEAKCSFISCLVEFRDLLMLKKGEVAKPRAVAFHSKFMKFR